MKKIKENGGKSILGVDKPEFVMIALKDFHIFMPPKHNIKIKEGDDLSGIPEIFIQNLITEKVLRKGN